jgi:hypothetical protein|tara:strand:- start:432 stop:788 length:357 start_codon:yes stop_codon:yes gene_type:complete
MTAVTDFKQDTATLLNQAMASPVQTLDGGRLIVRGGQSLLGAALILAAAGLWVMPGSEFSGDVMLMKLVLSLTAAFIGIMLTQQAKIPATPEVEIDTVLTDPQVRRSLMGGLADAGKL